MKKKCREYYDLPIVIFSGGLTELAIGKIGSRRNKTITTLVEDIVTVVWTKRWQHFEVEQRVEDEPAPASIVRARWSDTNWCFLLDVNSHRAWTAPASNPKRSSPVGSSAAQPSPRRRRHRPKVLTPSATRFTALAPGRPTFPRSYSRHQPQLTHRLFHNKAQARDPFHSERMIVVIPVSCRCYRRCASYYLLTRLFIWLTYLLFPIIHGPIIQKWKDNFKRLLFQVIISLSNNVR